MWVRRLSGKRIVPGGTRGIGAAVVRRAGTEGETVAALGLDLIQATKALPAPHTDSACDVSLITTKRGANFS